LIAPLVSVVVPAYNPREFLALSLGSAMAQTHRPVEVIVVDDGSAVPVSTALRGMRDVRCIRVPHGGVAAARNAGAAASHGRFLVFLDADDRLLPDAVAAGLIELASDVDSAFAAGLCRPIDPTGAPLPFRPLEEVGGDRYLSMLESNYIWMPAQVMYRREAFEETGGFDSRVDACADYDLYLRILRRRSVALHRRVVAEYRLHDGNMSSDLALMLDSTLRVLERQWCHVRGNPPGEHAWRNGRRFWQEHYGSGLVEQIRADLRTPHRRQRALRGAIVLLRRHPAEALRQGARKLRRTALDAVGANR
jgi:glycosyltransferase involved in cell wall biosynthesis